MHDRKTILIAEDDADVRSYLEVAIRCQGYAVECVEDGEEALAVVTHGEIHVDLVMLDALMPRKDGLDTLRAIRSIRPDLPVIMFSGSPSPTLAVEAMEMGAAEFLIKPLSHDDLCRAIRKGLEMRIGSAAVAARTTARETTAAFIPWSMHGALVSDFIEQVSMSDESVLLEGETGAGKEVLARQIHANSPRADKPFLKLNCAALPSELIESELFGYERGAFTGAFKNKPGKFELANGGTILLDEIGDMDFKLQAKLLHVLQDREFERLGGKDVTRVDVRVLAATHCDLRAGIRENRFREDLYYRLNVIRIRVPALRERKDEIVQLAQFLMNKHARRDVAPPAITPVLRKAILQYRWPGNVRELENVMRRYLIFRDADMIAYELGQDDSTAAPSPYTLLGNGMAPRPVVHQLEVHEVRRTEAEARVVLPSPRPAALRTTSSIVDDGDLPAVLGISSHAPVPALSREVVPPEPAEAASIFDRVNDVKRKAEAEAIIAALNGTRWNRKQAARLLQIDYKALLYKIRKLRIEDHDAAVPVPGTFIAPRLQARGHSA
jgi:two-component system, NtrC family, response regulator AtoC